MKRKKRLKKGIESIKNQIERHKKKLEQTNKEGNDILAEYYKKDLERLERQKRRKESKL